MGKRHTHFDDVESFLYVLLLFFFSYAGPLSKADLESAHENGFVQPIGSGSLPHMRCWPQQFADWADGKAQTISHSKSYSIWNPDGLTLLLEDAETRDGLKNNWPEDLQSPIYCLLRDAFDAFRTSMRGGANLGGRTELSHDKFVEILDDWLKEYSGLEDEHSNCPDFKDPRLV